MFDKIKNLFGKGKEEVISKSEMERRKKLNAELNHPDDNFLDDDFLEEEEMRRINEKSRKKGKFKNGYYAFGFLFAAVIIIYALVNMFKDAKFDLRILVQDDGFITETEIAGLEELVKPYVADKNEDGEIIIEVVTVSMPSVATEENQALFDSAVTEISKELTPYYISIVFGREDFVDAVNEIRPIKEEVKVSEIDELKIGDESALKEYYIAVRETVQKADKYSPVGAEIYKQITK